MGHVNISFCVEIKMLLKFPISGGRETEAYKGNVKTTQGRDNRAWSRKQVS